MSMLIPRYFVERAAAGVLPAPWALSDVTVNVAEDFLAARIWVGLQSRCGGYETRSYAPIGYERIEAGSLDDAIAEVRRAVEASAYEHAVYWQSKVWC